VFKVEQDLDRTLATPHLDRLAAEDRGKGGQALLAVEQQQTLHYRRIGLADTELAGGHDGIGLPKQDRARWVAAIQGVEQVADARGAPDVLALHFRELQVAPLDPVDEFGNFGFAAHARGFGRGFRPEPAVSRYWRKLAKVRRICT
jgi:hypothetical protein